MTLFTKFSVLLGFILISLHSFSQKERKKDQRPNIILIMADDLGWGDVGFNGNKLIQTPHLDQMASKGIIFNRFYAASPVCSPTRASCLTGRNPYRQGIYTANTGHLKKEEITLAEMLKFEGYATGMFGKWHLGTLTTQEKDANRGKPGDKNHYSTPDMHGFDQYFVTESKIPTFDPMIYPVQFDSDMGESLRYGWSAIENGQETKFYGTSYWIDVEEKPKTEILKGENTKLIMDQAIKFMQKSIFRDQSFFTVIWIHTPHLPVVADKDHRELYKDYTHQEQLYYGSITAMDEQIGRLKDFLMQQNANENTMIWFASDNGPELRTPGSAGLFRGKKRDLYEGGLRVPAFCVWPAKISQGSNTNVPIVTSDYLPTIAKMLKLKLNKKRVLDGMDITGIIDGTQRKRNKPIGFQYPNKKSWVTDEYKLIKNGKAVSYEMYHLKNDPQEQRNLILQEPKIARELELEMEDWIRSCKRSELVW